MNKDREIVLALIRNARKARRRMLEHKNILFPISHYLERLTAEYYEAHNAAETARRILYDYES